MIARLRGRFRLTAYGPDAESDPATFDPAEFVTRAVDDLARLRIDGVASSSDYPGCLVAALVAERLGLPGPSVVSVLRASHKFYARLSMARWVPEATPWFAPIDPRSTTGPEEPLPFPIFVKPVKSWFSQHAQVVRSAAELTAVMAEPQLRWHLAEFVRPFNQLLRRHPEFDRDASFLIGEELLTGHQVTVEGFVLDGQVQVTGILDSIMYPGTQSFERFVLPSAVASRTAQTMIDIVGRAVRGLGLSCTLFNVELIYDPVADTVHVLEVNPRMCGQFADLMEAVNGVNSYELLCEVALGQRPVLGSSSGRLAVAASFPRRRFSAGLVVAAPSADHIARVRAETSASLISVYYRTGERLADNGKQFDGASYRYATINVAADTRAELEPLADQVEDALGITITSVP